MKAPWDESRGFTPWLVLIAVALALALGFQRGILSLGSLEQNKDALSALSDLVAAVAIVVGGVLSYLRFFKGRVFQPKLSIATKTGSVPDGECHFHWIEIRIENRGSVPVWGYSVGLTATLHGHQTRRISVPLLEGIVEKRGRHEHLVDVGESSSEHAVLRVPKDVLAVSYEVAVLDHRGTRWQEYFTTANPVSPSPDT